MSRSRPLREQYGNHDDLTIEFIRAMYAQAGSQNHKRHTRLWLIARTVIAALWMASVIATILWLF